MDSQDTHHSDTASRGLCSSGPRDSAAPARRVVRPVPSPKPTAPPARPRGAFDAWNACRP